MFIHDIRGDFTIGNTNDSLGTIGNLGIVGDNDDCLMIFLTDFKEQFQDISTGLFIQGTGWFIT